MTVRTLPREGAAKIKIKSVLKYSWVFAEAAWAGAAAGGSVGRVKLVGERSMPISQLYLRSKSKLEINLPPGSGPKPRFLKETDSPDPPSGPTGGGGAREN